MRKNLLIVYLILLHLLIGVLVYRSGLIKNLGSATDAAKPAAPCSYNKMSREVLDRMDKITPDGTLVFLGDSLTESLAVSAVAPDAVDFGVSGDFISDLSERLPDYRSLEKARAIVVLIGTNDAAFEFTDEQLSAHLNELVKRLPAQPAIFWYSVPPVDTRIEKQRAPARIRQINLKIKELCAARAGCRFVDLTEAWSDNSGNLRSDYHIGDGYHFNEKGYRVWIESLKTQLPSRQNAK